MADFVVKLIDVYPDEVPITPTMSGYQLMVSADILRGRYRESLSDPKGNHIRRQVALPVLAADRQPCLPPRAPHHGTGAVELVPAL